MKVKDYAAQWLDRVGGRVAIRTLWAYRTDLREVLIPIGEIDLNDLRARHLRRIAEKGLRDGLAPETIRGRIRTLSSMLSAAVEDELIVANPAHSLRLHLPPTTPRPAFGRDQLSTFLSLADEVNGPHHASLWWTMARSGLRIGEALALEEERVDLRRAILTVAHSVCRDSPDGLGPTKNRRIRQVQIGPGLVERLTWLRAERPARWLFAEPCGERLHEKEASRMWVAVRKRLKLPRTYVPHSLRHTYASLLVADGAPLAFVQRQLGHHHISTTIDRYGCHAPMTGEEYLKRLEE